MSTQSGVPSNTPASGKPSAPRRSLSDRIFDLPYTRLGWLSIGLAFSFFVCYGLFWVMVAAGHRGGNTFGDNLWLAVPILATGASALGGGVAAAIAVIKQGERSFLVIGPLLLGLLVAIFLVLEFSFPH